MSLVHRHSGFHFISIQINKRLGDITLQRLHTGLTFCSPLSESSGNPGSCMGVTSFNCCRTWDQEAHGEGSQWAIVRQTKYTNKQKLVLLWKDRFGNKTEDRSWRLWFLRQQVISGLKKNESRNVGKCQLGTRQCEVRRSGFPLFFPQKLNTIPKELLSHKHLQPEQIKPCDGSTAIQLDWPHQTVCNKWWWWVTRTVIYDGELNVQCLQTLSLWPWLQDIAVCTTTHIKGWKCRNSTNLSQTSTEWNGNM